jgi:uncharacterized protein (TIGR03118 family)
MRHVLRRAVLSGLILLPLASARADFFVQTNLVTDSQAVTPAKNTDPNLINPWGIAFSSGSPFWVSDQGGSPGPSSQKATLYNGAGVPLSLVVTVPPSGSGFGPTGQVFNNTTGFVLSDGTAASFIFANLDGSISGWNGGAGTTALIAAPTHTNAFLTGLALANGHLYAADKGNSTVDVYDSTFKLVSAISEPTLPTGFSPYNVQLLSDGKLYVTFLNKANPNFGAVEILDPNNGTFQPLIPSTDAHLKEPWGVALAPAGFGPFGGDLLVGNKFNGNINAYNPTTGAFVGTLLDGGGTPITNGLGLWGLAFGTGAQGFDKNTLYFAAGVQFVPGGLGNDIYAHGLFGAITAVPEPGPILLLVVMATACGIVRVVRRPAA